MKNNENNSHICRECTPIYIYWISLLFIRFICSKWDNELSLFISTLPRM